MEGLTDKEIQEHIGHLKESIEKHENRIKTSVETIVRQKIELEKILIKYENRGV